MKVLVIYAHPATGGHCATILKEVEKRLKAAKQKYDLIDLYKLKYDPVLHDSEHYTRGKKKISAQNRKFQGMIKNADGLVFIYPVWWGSMPAILKGFIDRVFTPGFAFVFKGRIPVGLLKGKSAVIFMSTGGPKFLSGAASRFIRRGILRFCGIDSKSFVIGDANHLDDRQKDKIKKIVPKGLIWLYGSEW